jgi:hypothetical protein
MSWRILHDTHASSSARVRRLTVQLNTDATAVGKGHSSLGAQVPLLSTRAASFGLIVALACTVLMCLASTLAPLRERYEMKEARG